VPRQSVAGGGRGRAPELLRALGEPTGHRHLPAACSSGGLLARPSAVARRSGGPLPAGRTAASSRTRTCAPWVPSLLRSRRTAPSAAPRTTDPSLVTSTSSHRLILDI